jgi:hypothetical protein
VIDNLQLLKHCAVSLSYDEINHTVFCILLYHLPFILKVSEFQLPFASLFDPVYPVHID